METTIEMKAKKMNLLELRYALNNIKETMVIFKDKQLDDPYVSKLYREFDVYIQEIRLRTGK